MDCLRRATRQRAKKRRIVRIIKYICWSDEEFYGAFRFAREDMLKLHRCLRLPVTITCINGQNISSITCLHILLFRLAYPCTLWDLTLQFGYSEGQLSRIIHATLTCIFERWKHLLLPSHLQSMTAERLEMYVDNR